MNTLKFTVLLGLLTALTACVEPAPRFEAEFGQAARAALQAQIINPNAGLNEDPVAGLDGRAARDAIHTYQKSFIKPEPASNTFSIGVGGNTNN